MSFDLELTNAEIKELVGRGCSEDEQIGEISDGYHTFNELYAHRIELFISYLMLLDDGPLYNQIWRSRKHSDGSEWGGWFILGIFEEPGKQITYHLPVSMWDECNFVCKTLFQAPAFDGHTSADVLERLRNLRLGYKR